MEAGLEFDVGVFEGEDHLVETSEVGNLVRVLRGKCEVGECELQVGEVGEVGGHVLLSGLEDCGGGGVVVQAQEGVGSTALRAKVGCFDCVALQAVNWAEEVGLAVEGAAAEFRVLGIDQGTFGNALRERVVSVQHTREFVLEASDLQTERMDSGADIALR